METKFNKYVKLSDDIIKLDDKIDDYEKVKEIEIVQITGIISEEEASKIDENFVIHAGDFSGKDIKRGDSIYLSCLMKKPGLSYTSNQQGVIKCRVSEIWFGLSKLNSIIK